jgi:hypothetical protein
MRNPLILLTLIQFINYFKLTNQYWFYQYNRWNIIRSYEIDNFIICFVTQKSRIKENKSIPPKILILILS